MFRIERNQSGKRRIFITNKAIFTYYNPFVTLKYLAIKINNLANEMEQINVNWGGGWNPSLPNPA